MVAERRVAEGRVPAGVAGLARLDDDEVEADGELRKGRSVRKPSELDESPGRGPDAAALAVVDGFLTGSVFPRPPAPHLDNDELPRRARVDRHEIELVATDMDVPGKDRPAGGSEPVRHERLGCVADELCLGPVAIRGLGVHTWMVAEGTSLAVNRGLAGSCGGWQRGGAVGPRPGLSTAARVARLGPRVAHVTCGGSIEAACRGRPPLPRSPGRASQRPSGLPFDVPHARRAGRSDDLGAASGE